VYAALIVTPATLKNPELILLENGTDMETRLIKYYRNAIQSKLTDDRSYNQFWKPIADHLTGINKVYFSADGVYNQINLNTLYNPGSKKYLLDELEVQVVTSTRDLIDNNFSVSNAVKEAYMFGFPDYNGEQTKKSDSARSITFEAAAELKKDAAQRFLNGENINELPGTRKEVETIQSLLRKNNVNQHVYMFDKATEAEIKKLNNPQLLHVATHGFFMADIPTDEPGKRSFTKIESKKIVENPLLRSGLLFAEAKRAFIPNKEVSTGEDGVLTAYEAMNLNLDKTDLVVLSACETGLGVTSNGEGVYGLQRAFQVAGAKSVLMSLWTVSDEATQQLMTLFYEYWLSGKTPREAFRMAQLSLREKFPEPYFWGAFVLVGE
jgi:CHAT domain-containing protein